MLSLLMDRLHGRSSASRLLRATDHVPLPDLVDLLRLLGELSADQASTDRKARSLEVDDSASLMCFGAETLSNLPTSFEATRDRVVKSSSGKERGAHVAYGLPLVRWMRSD